MTSKWRGLEIWGAAFAGVWRKEHILFGSDIGGMGSVTHREKRNGTWVGDSDVESMIARFQVMVDTDSCFKSLLFEIISTFYSVKQLWLRKRVM